MKLQYLGDALDHWKGAIIDHLQADGQLDNFAIDPMISDAAPWNAADLGLFASLLHVKTHQILPHVAKLPAQRTAYFEEVIHPGDLFLDPDTGVATCAVRNLWQYVTPSEVRQLLARHDSRVVAVYQHIRARRARRRVEEIVDKLRDPQVCFAACSYESSTVAMLFLSRAERRIRAINDSFRKRLGCHAEERIHSW